VGLGWKPALAFRFVEAHDNGGGSSATSADQRRRALEELRAATATAEREVEAVQESLAGPRVLDPLRRQTPAERNGGEVADEAVAAVGRSLRVLLASADALRERTVRALVGLLPPEQAGTFVAAMLRFHISVRRTGRDWGRRGV
jgi:hypothetical protein